MVKGRIYKTLINMIVIVSLLLALCVCVDYAANETTVSNMDQVNDSVKLNDNNVINGTSYVGVEKKDKVTPISKIVVEKPKLPLVTITAKPSCGCGRHYSYRWRTKTFIDYCPHCHRYGVLRNVHKWQAKYEQELTCTHCGADYCGNCGHEKYSWSKYYLRRA